MTGRKSMPRRIWVPVAVFGVACLMLPALTVPSAGQDVNAAAKPTDAEIRQLVQRLGAPTYAEREKAQKALEAIGEAALPALKEAAQKSEDQEVRRRAADLARIIEARTIAQRLRQPSLISVAYDGTPVPEVLKDLEAKTGIVFENDPAERQKWAGKQISLRIDKAPLWEVVDRVLAACGLRPAAPELPDKNRRPVPLPQSWRLEEGQLQRESVCYAGSVRVCLLRLNKLDDGNWEGWLEICVEPKRYTLRGQPRLREATLLDQTGQPIQAKAEITQHKTPEEEALEQLQRQIQLQVPPGGNAQIQIQIVPGNARIIAPGMRPGVQNWRCLAQLHLRDLASGKAPTRLQAVLELDVFQVRQVSIEKPLEAAGKTFGEANEFQFRLKEVKQAGPQLIVTLETNKLPQLQLPIQVQGPGNVVGAGIGDPSSIFCQLFDDKGNLFPQVGYQAKAINQGGAQSYELTYRFLLLDGQQRKAIQVDKEVARLVVTHRSAPTMFDVPVTLPLDKASR
jgi:hypothetical protein